MLQWSLENAPVEPETAKLEPLEVLVEPRSAAVEQVAAPVEPVVAPADKGSSPSAAPEALSFSRGLAFSPSGATWYLLLPINEAWS